MSGENREMLHWFSYLSLTVNIPLLTVQSQHIRFYYMDLVH